MGPRGTRRAALLGAAALVAGFQFAPRALDWWDDDFEFEDLETPQGFRRLVQGQSGDASRLSLLVGLDTQTATTPDQAIPDLCESLFASGPGIKVAAFSDYYCPYCRVLDARVRALADEGLIFLRHHETPIFGPRSVWAARGAIAARAQGQGDAYFSRMIRSQVIANPVYLRNLAADLGLDPQRFAADMQSATTEAEIAQSAALARLFRFVGTPALVVGRTALQGAITETNLRQLIDLESDQSANTPCG